MYWRYIAQSIDGLLATVEGLSAAQLNWHPPAADANSLYALATHTMGKSSRSSSILCAACPSSEAARPSSRLSVRTRWHSTIDGRSFASACTTPSPH